MNTMGAKRKIAVYAPETAPSAFVNPRINLFLLGFVLIGLALAFRLFQLTVLDSDRLRRHAAQQMTSSLDLRAERGLIKDRTGRNLAMNVAAQSVYVIANQIEDPRESARELAAALDLDADAIYRRIRDAGGFVWIARQVSGDVELSELLMRYHPALGVVEESKRFYPDGAFAPQVVGFAGVDNQGLWGVEVSLDGVLSGTSGLISLLRDAKRMRIPNSGSVIQPKHDGHTVTLTLDPVIQHIAQRELDAAIQGYQAVGGVVIVIDPVTGEALAMASNPSFDANEFALYDKETYRNRALSQIVEPGSTMKPIIAALALREGLDPYARKYNCLGRFRVGAYHIQDINQRNYGYMSLEEIVVKSSNIGAAQISMELGQEKVESFLREVGFGEPVGMELGGEERGLFPSQRRWPEITLANVAFGQGMAATPIQLVRAFTIFANQGVMVSPYLIQQIESVDGRSVRNAADPPRIRVLQPQQAAVVREMLVKAVYDGTGRRAAVPGYTVAGKTGTSQKPNRHEPGYDPDRFVASFIGFLPARDPRLLILVMIDEPDGRALGGAVAAPIFAAVAQEAILHLRIPPEVQIISRGAGND